MKSVLILEDEIILALHLELAFRNAGFHVVGIAATEVKALKLASVHRPDLLIADIRLKNSDGIEIARQVLEFLDCDVIFATATTNAEARARAQALRPLAFVTKPYRPDEMIRMIREYWDRQESTSGELHESMHHGEAAG